MAALSDEKKEPQHPLGDAVNAAQAVPEVFDAKWNTDDIDWNELFDLAVHKGRILIANNVIQQHYGQHIEQQEQQEEKEEEDGLKIDIPDLPAEILAFIRQVVSESSIALRSHAMLHSHSGWETQVDGTDGISVYYKDEDSANGVHSIKVSFSSKCHPVDFIAVINEFDLINEIVTIIPMETRYLKQFTEMNKVLYSKMKMWWPLKDRDAVE